VLEQERMGPARDDNLFRPPARATAGPSIANSASTRHLALADENHRSIFVTAKYNGVSDLCAQEP
jgi:hypothetical protein